MKKFTIMLSLLVILASCKKDPSQLVPELLPEPTPELLDASGPGRVSLIVNGTLFTNFNPEDKGMSFSKKRGNSGANLKETTKESKWTVMSNGKYWAGHSDSLQYFKSFETSLGSSGASIEIFFIKKYAKKDMLTSFDFYYPKTDSDLYKITDPKFALDFQRENDQEGVAIEVYLPNLGTLTSFSPIMLGKKSSLTAESHRNSTFKIRRAERVKDSKIIEIELDFEGDLFDKNEQAVRVTKCTAIFQLREGDAFGL